MGSAIETFDRVSILYDTELPDQPTPGWFQAGHWPHHKPLEVASGGRGRVFQVAGTGPQMVLRHFYRGGLPGKLLNDSYLFTGLERTRSFAEWRILELLYREGLPVPKPVAAQVCRRGLWYFADLLTVQLDNVQSLAVLDRAGRLEEQHWYQVGRVIRRFHNRGVFHADLNAANVQLDSDAVWLLDFDRGAIRSGDDWKPDNLARLLRSLNKQWRRSDPEQHPGWRCLLEGYAAA